MAERDALEPGAQAALDAARATVRGARCWILSDGKAGDEVQCIGVAERLGLAYEVRRVAPRPPFVWLMPHGPIDPAEAAHRPGSPLAGQLPDIVIASGRRTVPYLRWIHRRMAGRGITVFLKDPRTGIGAADLIWVPQHDTLRGANVLHTITSPHRISAEALADAAPPAYARWPLDGRPHVALLIGGDSRHFRFTQADIAAFDERITRLAASGVALLATASRRTPPALLASARQTIEANSGFLWPGTGENPYLALLARADAIVTTADSVNMVGEAVATGKPVHVFAPSGGSPKINSFLTALTQAGAIRPFDGAVDMFRYAPIDATPEIAIALAQMYRERQRTRNHDR